MANDGFTIRIFVPDGDPEGVRIVDRMNWTGLAIAFPREKWLDTRSRREFDNPGVYILSGYGENESDDDLPTIYVGEGDGIRDRLNSHAENKDFWDTAYVFVSGNRGLNKAHIQWLEYALLKRAIEIRQCVLDNGCTPQEPALTESEKADTSGFLKEIYRILPLLGLRVFESAKKVFTLTSGPVPPLPVSNNIADDMRDTIVVPANPDGFRETFLGENCWYSIRISGGMKDKIRWIATYQTAPVGAVTHHAPVERIEPYGDSRKFKVVFAEPAKELVPIPYADAPKGAIQSPRYTNYKRLMSAKKLTDLLGDGT